VAKAYRDRLSFRALSLVLSFDWRWAALVIGIIYLPFMLMGDFTIAFIAFMLALWGVFWIASVPRMKQTDDGVWYFMDATERAEWVFENKRFPKL